MKIKFLALITLLALAFNSCSLDDDTVNIRLEALPITSVEIPDPFVFGEINEIVVRYDNPTGCYQFYAFDVRSELNVREVTVLAETFDASDCGNVPVPTERILRFLPISNGTVDFKFFSGLDADGNREFIEITVDVVE